jgi:hypothetical protein
MQVVARFDIASLIPADGRLPFGDIAKQTPLTEQMVGRIVRHAATMRIFCEPERGIVAHTKVSRVLSDPAMRDRLRAGTEEMGPAAGKASPSITPLVMHDGNFIISACRCS